MYMWPCLQSPSSCLLAICHQSPCSCAFILNHTSNITPSLTNRLHADYFLLVCGIQFNCSCVCWLKPELYCCVDDICLHCAICCSSTLSFKDCMNNNNNMIKGLPESSRKGGIGLQLNHKQQSSWQQKAICSMTLQVQHGVA